MLLHGLRQLCLYGECEISILCHDGDKVACHTFNLCCCSCLRETDTGNLKNPVFFARTNDDLICFSLLIPAFPEFGFCFFANNVREVVVDFVMSWDGES